MDSHHRNKENKSFQLIAKSIVASAFLGLTSCTSTPSSVPKELQSSLKTAGPLLDVSSLGIQLTKIGFNDSPSLSADGKKIAFAGRGRPSHSQSQIYFFDLEQLTERRITYQDGECRDPILNKDGKKIIYASSTDELKERPVLLQPQPTSSSSWPPTDIYESDLSGIEIKRLLQRPGFDGFPWLRHEKSILYSQWNGKFIESWQLNLDNRTTVPVFAKKDRSILSLRLSPNGKQWVWVETGEDGRSALVTSATGFQPHQQKILPLPAGDFDSVEWWDDQKIYFSSRSLKKNFQIYSYQIKDQCLQLLFEHDSNITSPHLNPSKEGIVFVSDANGGKQIYYKSLSAPSDCLKYQ